MKNIDTQYSRINFIFLRHGNACHNIMKAVMSKKPQGLDKEIKDAQLTHFGVDFSIWSGCLIKNILKIMGSLYKNYDDIEEIDIIGTSPLIRSIETGYYITKNWTNKPKSIHVFPYLRELDERIFNIIGFTKYSDPSIYNIPQYAVKKIDEQKSYLQNVLNDDMEMIDFTYVEKFKKERESAGDINLFIKWFFDNFKEKLVDKKIYNVVIITHSGVIREFFNKLVFNNFGLILPVFIKDGNLEIKKDMIVDIEELFPDDILKNVGYMAKNVCGLGQNRCNIVCSEYNFNNNKLLDEKIFEPMCYEIKDSLVLTKNDKNIVKIKEKEMINRETSSMKNQNDEEDDDNKNIEEWMNI